MRKGWRVIMLTTLLSIVCASPAMAETGWVAKEDGSWNYYNEDGTLMTNGWAKSGNDWYYFGGDGNIVYNSLIEDQDKTYFVDAEGIMALNEWVQYNNAHYYAGEDGALLKSTVTPDGYMVDANGVWDGKDAVAMQGAIVEQEEKISAPIHDEYLPFGFERNSVDGIEVYWSARNKTGKTINYYTLTIEFYNRVGDPAFDELTKRSYKKIKFVGPIEPGGELALARLVGYIPACDKVVISQIKLEYDDGTTETIDYGYGTSTRV